MHKMHCKIIAVLTCLLVVILASNFAAAQTNVLPQTYVPWLESQGYVPKGHAAPERKNHSAAQAQNRRDHYRSEKDRRKIMRQDQPPSQTRSDSFNATLAALGPDELRALAHELNKLEPSARPSSALEHYYSQRIVDDLEQFGYDLFNETSTQVALVTPNSLARRALQMKSTSQSQNNSSADAAYPDAPRFNMPAGAVQDDFILGTGDRLTVLFRGQKQTNGQYMIHSNGQLVIEDLPPVTAAGRPLGTVRKQLEDVVARYYNTDVFVSLDAVRQINILVMGHVENPGRKTLTVFHTVIDALMESGGVEKTGSLRQIKLVRDGRSTYIDLYSLFMHGSTHMDMGLRDGDRLIIPSIGPTIAISGGVKRPGIYEIKPVVHGVAHTRTDENPKLSLDELLDMAGGLLSPGENRFVKFSLTNQGIENVQDIDNSLDPLFGDGSILKVTPSTELRKGTVELVGHTRKPGLYDLDQVSALSDLINTEGVFGGDIYPLIGVIERWDEHVMSTRYIDFPPLLVLQKQFDRTLKDGDVVHLFSRTQILNLEKQSQSAASAYQHAQVELGSIEPSAGAYYNNNGDLITNDTDFIQNKILSEILLKRATFIRGAVRTEGKFPVAEGTTLEHLIAVAGGLTLEASINNIEVTSALNGQGDQTDGKAGTRRTHINFAETNPEEILLAAGDSVHVKQKFQKIAERSVEIIGEVENPGRYDLLAGDKLSDLLRRAGGLTPQAYADGTIFSRQSARRAEEARFKAAARELQRSLASAMGSDEPPQAAQITSVRQLIAELNNIPAVGRITVEADPAALVVEPELDVLLETGDRIYVPKRPLSVRVSGEVLSPAVLQFRSDKNARDYIAEAGGISFNADKGRSFVLYPDGSAEPLSISSWNHNTVFIPPGSTIVVPTDPAPMTFMQTARDFSQILSNLAITGIFLDDLDD